MQRIWYRENLIPCGHYADVQIYPVFSSPKGRGKKKKPTSAVQEKLNEHNSKRELERIIELNFTSKDYVLHLTYADGFLPESWEQMRRDVQNLLRKVKRIYIREGVIEKGSDLKYIWVPERGEESGRLHFHIIISHGIDMNTIWAIWNKGFCSAERLRFSKNGIENLSQYVTKERFQYRRWSSSKNLVRPVAHPRDNTYKRRELKAICEQKSTIEEFEKRYPGWAVCEEPFKMHNKVNGGYYVAFKLYRYIIWPRNSDPPKRVPVAQDERFEKIWREEYKKRE